MGVGEILDVAINVIARNVLTFIKIMLVIVVPIQALTVVVLVATIQEAGDLSTGPTIGNESAFVGGLVIVLVFQVLLGALATAACFKAISDAYLGHEPDWRSSLGFAFRRLHSVIWIRILAYAAAFIPAAIAVGIAIAIAPGLGVLVGIAAVGFVIWLLVSWAVGIPALLFEGVKGTKALGRSFGLVKNGWWRTFGVMAIAVILVNVLTLIISALVEALSFTDVGDSVFATALLNSVGNGIGQIIATPVTAAAAAIVYYDLRVRREGFDLQLMAERLGVVAPAGGVPWARRGASPGPPPPPGAQPVPGPPPPPPGSQQTYPPPPRPDG